MATCTLTESTCCGYEADLTKPPEVNAIVCACLFLRFLGNQSKRSRFSQKSISTFKSVDIPTFAESQPSCDRDLALHPPMPRRPKEVYVERVRSACSFRLWSPFRARLLCMCCS
jgi:hypothetical protein